MEGEIPRSSVDVEGPALRKLDHGPPLAQGKGTADRRQVRASQGERMPILVENFRRRSQGELVGESRQVGDDSGTDGLEEREDLVAHAGSSVAWVVIGGIGREGQAMAS
jgi:hypothetical protein